MKVYISVDVEGVSGLSDADSMHAAEIAGPLSVMGSIGGEFGCSSGRYG